MTCNARSRAGFTLVEALVVFGLISVVLGLMIPALQSATESARRTRCINAMKQLGTSLHTYHNVYESFPSGVIDRAGPIKHEPAGYHVGWVVQVLPYLEQGMLSMSMSETTSVYDPANKGPRTTELTVMLCPSDVGPKQGKDGAFGSNYKGCHHDVEAPIASDNHGVLFLNSRIRYEDVEDGTTETLMLGEALRSETDLGWVTGTRSTLRNTGSPINGRDLWKVAADQARWNDGAPVFSSGGPPDPERKTVVGGFGSRHPGGANFMFCDGSVRFLSETIDRTTFQRLGHRADGEMISLTKTKR